MSHRTTTRRPVAAIAGALLCALSLHSGGAAAIGLLGAYEAALKNDPTYRGAYFDAEGGKEARIIGRAGLLPNVSSNYSASKNRADTETVTTGPLGRKNLTHPEYMSRSESISVRQPLLNLDALARYRQGMAQSDYSAIVFTGRTQELALRVVGAYLDALLANEQLQLAQVQRDMYVEQRRVNDRLFEKGEGARTDMIETQARLDLAEAQVLEAVDNQRNALASLSAIVGEEVASLDVLAPEFRIAPVAPASLEGWKAIALDKNPEVLGQTRAVEVALQEIKKARAGHAPRVDFVASYSKTAAETINTFNQDSTIRSVGVQMNIPLYAGGSVSAATRQAVAGHEKAKTNLQAAIDKTLVELRKQYGLVVSSAARIEALVKAVNSSKLLVKATEQSIKGGVRINLDLLNAQQQLYTGQRDLAQARYNYLMATLRLRAAAGTLAFDDVREIAGYFR